MKILLVNKYYYNRGGSETYLLAVEKMLKSKGHQVRIFSMKHPDNLATSDEKYFIKYHNFQKLSLISLLKESWQLFYRPESVKQLKKLLQTFRPDVVHLNNINFQITTSIIDYLKKEKIPLVMTLHDYQLICPNHLLYHDGRYCQTCSSKKFYHCFVSRCYQKSYLKSLLATMESYFNHGRKVYDKIDVFISPSQFLKQKMAEFGFPESKILAWPNFLDLKNFVDINPAKSAKEKYILFAGRLTEEKGIMELLDFFQRHPGWTLKIIGQGEKQAEVTKAAGANIKYYGHLSSQLTKQMIAEAQALILPSKWPENCPYIILEALALGTPVIATPVGGIAELIQHQSNGFLINNLNQLNEILPRLETDEKLQQKLNQNARLTIRQYDVEQYYNKLIALYKQLSQRLTFPIK